MEDLKSVTVSYLRDLARKHLGSGYSKLNKKELIAALARFVPALKRLARLAGVEPSTRAKAAPKAASAPSKPAREARVAKKEPERKKEPAKKEPAKKEPERKKEPAKKAAPPQDRKPAPRQPASPQAEDDSQSPRPAQVVNFPPRPRSALAEAPWHEELVEESETLELEVPPSHPAEPLVEGFFVARVMGERELRRHHLTEDQAPRGVMSGAAGYEENLGELPPDHGNDLALALARDPHTLFVAWDFSPAARARASEGLESPRAILRVFDGDRLVREEEFALESRSFYIHGLPPGRTYRVEAHLVGQGGRSRRLGHSTHPLALPQTGPSPDTSVRFMRMPPPPPVPSGEIPEPLAASAPPSEQVEEREYISWRRVPLPGSAGTEEVPEERRERRARRAPESAGPPTHLDVSARPPGSSEQLAGGPHGPGGASEQLSGGLLRRGGASEQIHWTPPPSGRGR